MTRRDDTRKRGFGSLAVDVRAGAVEERRLSAVSSAKALFVAVLLTGCGAPVGTRCSPSDPCPAELVCSFPEPHQGLSEPVGVCDHPLLEHGAPCSRADECLEALTCSVHFEPGERRGVCVERRSEGAACWVDRDCLSGRCDGGGGDTVSGSCGAP